MSKKTTGKESFYTTILNTLETSTNLTNLRNKLSISKQNLNYYIRQLKRDGLIQRIGKGYYEVVKSSKKTTKYGNHLVKDSIRGHAYVWTIKFPKEIDGWNNRISILKAKGINFNLVGALRNTPRIKVIGRKIWLCNNHIRIFDKANTSYYGNSAVEAKRKAFLGILEVVSALESKLGFTLKPLEININKEHYALIKNDLAIDHNKKGIILRVSDKDGEWLLIDDSLGEGGELETIGKSAFTTNLQLQKWWNEQKETNFKVTPSFLLDSINKVTLNQQIFDNNMKSHLDILNKLRDAINELKKEIHNHGNK